VEELTEFAVCALAQDSRIEVLGIFTNTQAEVCRDLLHKITPDTVVIIGPWANGELLDETTDTAFCEWGVFRTHPDDEPELLEVFAFRSNAAEALAAVQRYRNLTSYSLAEMRAALQMLQWVQITAFMTKEEPVRSRQLLALAKRVGHQAFRDIFVRLAPIHVEAQALGMQANGITDYNRSHDNACA
jgi:hypothetical protein